MARVSARIVTPRWMSLGERVFVGTVTLLMVGAPNGLWAMLARLLQVASKARWSRTSKSIMYIAKV